MADSCSALVWLGALSSSLMASLRLSTVNGETTLAIDGAESAIERLRSVPLQQVFFTYNANPEDDPGDPADPSTVGSAPGFAFDVPGLEPQVGDPDGRVGRIDFPGDGVELLENVDDPGLGMPRDLNGDAMIDSYDHSKDYVLLPVRVHLEWWGAAGHSELETRTLLADF